MEECNYSYLRPFLAKMTLIKPKPILASSDSKILSNAQFCMHFWIQNDICIMENLHSCTIILLHKNFSYPDYFPILITVVAGQIFTKISPNFLLSFSTMSSIETPIMRQKGRKFKVINYAPGKLKYIQEKTWQFQNNSWSLQ